MVKSIPKKGGNPLKKFDPLRGAAKHNKDLLLSMHQGIDDAVVMEKSMVDAEKGFATQPMSYEELVKHLRVGKSGLSGGS